MIKEHISHFFVAFKYSLQGLRAAFKHEMAFKQEVVIFIILIAISFILDVSAVERSLMLGSWLLVMLVELINSSIESVVDRISSEQHELSGRAKDQASAAVLLAIVISIIIWTGVLLK